MNYDFIIKPSKILFEHKHMDGTFKVGKKYKSLKNKLKTLGYKLKYKYTENTMFELSDGGE